ncbi:MAG: shpI [Pseudonocardiales bacterium]|nr:shpI [Pseudonocardiales bacterium]
MSTQFMGARSRRGSNPRRRAVAAIGAGALAFSLAVAFSPAASAAPAGTTTSGAAQDSDVREISPKANYSTKNLGVQANRVSAKAAAAPVTPPVGTKRTLLGLDDYNGELYFKQYTLKAVGAHIEVWVADDTAFPAGDCRLAVPNTTTVTVAQAQSLVSQFETNMFPKESQAFSVAPDRDGSGNALVSHGVDSSGSGDKIMTLVDNVRDDNYYLGVEEAGTYIAGFFSSQFNELLDRNVMTIDAYDWLHRTGANPADAQTPNVCTSRPSRPFLYEGTFAHEYQHLLEYYQDPSEVNWVNEGLSDFAESLVGYGDVTKTVFQANSQSHIYCYQGFGTVQTQYNPNPRDCGGPENSLTLWGDQGSGDDILADYGNAWSFMLFLRDRYGVGFMSSLHRDGLDQGLVGLQHQLDGYSPGADVFDVLHDFQTATLLDGIVGVSGGTVAGIARSRVTSASLNSMVNLGNPKSYAAPGAPANGADFVGLRGSSGLYLKGKDLSSLSFTSSRTLAPEAMKWTSVTNAPTHGTNAALWSGNSTNLDAPAIVPVTVPTTNPTLSFSELHLAEPDYDYAYTTISTDGGATYTPLANANTVEGPLGPALNGDATAFVTQTFDLSAYAGKSVLIGFRYVSDGGVNDGGWYIDDVKVGSTLISDGTSTAPFKSTTQIRPFGVYSFTIRIIGVNTDGHTALVRRFTSRTVNLSPAQVAEFHAYPRVVVQVSYDEPSEQLQPQALYTLKANGVVQPGGGQAIPVAVVAADVF